jgi:hypothetical protein
MLGARCRRLDGLCDTNTSDGLCVPMFIIFLLRLNSCETAGFGKRRCYSVAFVAGGGVAT